MKRYSKIILEAKRGTTFEVVQEKNGELCIKVVDVKVANEYSVNYINPPVPLGFRYVKGRWNTGFVIERIADGSKFTWVPVGYLDANGTIDGINFNEKFGRRNYRKEEFSEFELSDSITSDYTKTLESIKKCGGFYISSYDISKNPETGEPQSVEGAEPWTDISGEDAQELAKFMIIKNEAVSSYLPFGSEYDCIFEWIIKSGAKAKEEVAVNSTSWGNYLNARRNNVPNRKANTGSDEKYCVNEIWDLAGNVSEWTQEKGKRIYNITRGGCFYDSGRIYPAAYRGYRKKNETFVGTGFRVALRIN